MPAPTAEIQELIDREARAWDDGDVESLLSIFHPDAVWVWPQTHGSMDPLDWTMTVGRFDAERWKQGFSRILSCDILRNERLVHSIDVSPEGDGAVAVVDIDIEWRTARGSLVRWAGRAMKYYSQTRGAWKLIAHTGL
jgi:ketosteroid isomerase-like protein